MSMLAVHVPGLVVEKNPITGRQKYRRPCDRCATLRIVRDPRATLNLCRDCREVLSPAERERWRS